MTAAVSVRRTGPMDLPYVTALERRPENRDLVGQWSDAEHAIAIGGRQGWEHWVIERDGRPAGYMIVADRGGPEGGVYVKRILVEDKERGTGKAALGRFVELALARPGRRFVWLNVREPNARAQAVYRAIGFERFEANEEELASGEGPGDGVFSMKRRAAS